MRMIDRRGFIAGVVAPGVACEVAGAGTPRSAFGPQSTAEEVTAGLDLKGKTAVVTGCNSGIGFETMQVLALPGRTSLVRRERRKREAQGACNKVTGRATPVVLELADFPSVVACAERIRALTPRVDMLILNAGVVYKDLHQVYGMEEQFVVNHLGHFLLTQRIASISLKRENSARHGRKVTRGRATAITSPAGGHPVRQTSQARAGQTTATRIPSQRTVCSR